MQNVVSESENCLIPLPVSFFRIKYEIYWLEISDAVSYEVQSLPLVLYLANGISSSASTTEFSNTGCGSAIPI